MEEQFLILNDEGKPFVLQSFVEFDHMSQATKKLPFQSAATAWLWDLPIGEVKGIASRATRASPPSLKDWDTSRNASWYVVSLFFGGTHCHHRWIFRWFCLECCLKYKQIWCWHSYNYRMDDTYIYCTWSANCTFVELCLNVEMEMKH